MQVPGNKPTEIELTPAQKALIAKVDVLKRFFGETGSIDGMKDILDSVFTRIMAETHLAQELCGLADVRWMHDFNQLFTRQHNFKHRDVQGDIGKSKSLAICYPDGTIYASRQPDCQPDVNLKLLSIYSFPLFFETVFHELIHREQHKNNPINPTKILLNSTAGVFVTALLLYFFGDKLGLSDQQNPAPYLAFAGGILGFLVYRSYKQAPVHSFKRPFIQTVLRETHAYQAQAQIMDNPHFSDSAYVAEMIQSGAIAAKRYRAAGPEQGFPPKVKNS